MARPRIGGVVTNNDDRTLMFPRSRRWIAPLSLAGLLLPTVRLVQRDTGASLVLSLVALAVFGCCLVRVALTTTRPDSGGPASVTWSCIAAMAAVAVAVPLLHPDISWTCLQVYVTITLALALPLRLVPHGIAGGVALAACQNLVHGTGSSGSLGSLLTVLGLGTATFGLRRSGVLVRHLEDAQGEVARLAAVEERLRIARDLHDLVGHSLSLIVVKSELAGRLAEIDPRAAAGEIADVESVARESLDQVRDAVTGYRQRSLVEVLDDARSALAAAAVRAIVRLPRRPLPGDIDQLLAWVVREGVTNVIRHAQATRCEITVAHDGEQASLDIVDDGRGLAADDDEGNGLVGLAERIAMAGGRLGTGSASGRRGFRLAVRVPIAPRQPAARDNGSECFDRERAEPSH